MSAKELSQTKARIKKNLKILQAIKAKWRPQKERFPIIYKGFKDQERALVDQYNEIKKQEKNDSVNGDKKPASKSSKKAGSKKEPKEKEKMTLSLEDDDMDSDDSLSDVDMEIADEKKKIPFVDTKAETIGDDDAIDLEDDDDDDWEDDDDDDDDPIDIEMDDDDDDDKAQSKSKDKAKAKGKDKKEDKAKKEESKPKKGLPFGKGKKLPAKGLLKKGGAKGGGFNKDKLKGLKNLKKKK